MEMKRKIFAVLFLALVAVVLPIFAVSCDGGEDDVDGGESSDKYTVTYTDEHGNKQSVSVSAGESISLAPAIKAGCVFEGYYTASGMKCFDSYGKPVSGLVITSDMELYPKHTPFKYSFVFNAQEGSFDGGDKIAQREFQYGEELLGVSLPVPQSPVAKYEFDGWFSEDGKTRYSDGDEPVYPVLNSQGYPIGENGGEVKLIAVYKVKQYTVTLDFADDETMPVTLTVEHGSSLSGFLKYEKDNGSAYLKGWSVDRYGSFPVPDKVTEDLYLYAVWQEYKNITFVYSDTKSEVFKIDVTSGKTSKLPETAELPGYDFEGWYSSELCIGKPITEVYYGNIQDKYYAKWSAAEYTINFVTSNGDVLEDIVYTYGDTDVLPTLTRYGYDFGGWRVNENNGSGFYNIPAKNNVVETLKILKSEGADLNVLTASPHATLDPCLKRLGIYDIFTNVWSCEDFNTTKADPQIYKMAAEKMNAQVNEVLFLDDNFDADKTAKKAGMLVCGVYDRSSEDYREDIKSVSDFYIDDFKELLDIKF